jgi:Ca-activated chloride channel family protein
VSFLWPPMLLSLALIPAGILAYRAIGRRRRLAAARAGLTFTGAAPGGRQGIQRRIPAALFVMGFAVMAVALARPQGVVSLPREEGTVILAFDVSGSMAATDLLPTRLDAARAAAKDFLERQPPSVLIGVVAFSDSGLSVQAPTNDPAAVLAAMDRLAPERGTSLATGISASLDAIALAAAGPSVDYYSNRSPAPTPAPTPVPPGTHAPAVIVLLTDGENTVSPDPAAAAQAAADRGVRIYTVGVGSQGGATLDLNGFMVHTQLDDAELRQIAQVTGGAYYGAGDAQSLRSVYDHLDTQLVVRPEAIEITSIFAGASILILTLGGLSALLWLGRLP